MSENKEPWKADFKCLNTNKDSKYITGCPIVKLSVKIYSSTFKEIS